MVNLKYFLRFGPFPHVSAQVKEWVKLELHEMMRVLHAAAWPFVFILLCDLNRQSGVLRLMKNAQFLVFLAVRVIFPKFLGRLRRGLY